MIHQLADQVFVSGEDLANQFGVTRATIASWVQDLQYYGLEINKVRGKGYRLANPIDLLDKNRILSAISPQIRSKVGIVDVTLETDSTNETALSAHYNQSLWHLYSTEFQKTGRGRRGRQWLSPLGTSLMFTLSSKRQWSLDVLYLASLLVGLSAAQHLKQHLGKNVQLKWPNDLYLNGLKLGGILCELRGSPQDEALLVIGVGLNVYKAPQGTDRQATCLFDCGPAPLDRSVLLAGLSESVIRDLDFAAQQGPAELLSVWDDFDFLKDRDINVLQGEQIISGQALGIDEKGQLKLLCSNGKVQVFNGGEVSVRW